MTKTFPKPEIHLLHEFPDATSAAAAQADASMTLAALLSSTDRLLLAFSGAAKREVFKSTSRQPCSDLPVSLLLDAAKTRGKLDVYWHP